MAGADWSARDSVMQHLADEKAQDWLRSSSFFHLVRRVECADPARPRIGRARQLRQDPVRFGQLPSLAFAPSTIAAARPGPTPEIPRLLVQFYGLMGPNGPLPLHVTETVHQRRESYKDASLADFLDIFHHRLISLFYRAWALNQQTVSYDRPDDDRIGRYVASIVGIGMPALQGRDSIVDDAKRYYAGRLASPTKSADGLRAILGDFFGVPTRIEPFQGQWIDLPPGDRCRIGRSRQSGTLGETIVIGTRTWDCHSRFRIVLGALSFADFTRFLPPEPGFRRLVDWVRLYIGEELAWDLQLVLKAPEIPATQLGSGGLLGWTTWLQSRPFREDRGDVVLRPPRILDAMA